MLPQALQVSIWAWALLEPQGFVPGFKALSALKVLPLELPASGERAGRPSCSVSNRGLLVSWCELESFIVCFREQEEFQIPNS